jgi:hypothetical protein
MERFLGGPVIIKRGDAKCSCDHAIMTEADGTFLATMLSNPLKSLQIATAIFAETLGNLQHSSGFLTGSRSQH